LGINAAVGRRPDASRTGFVADVDAWELTPDVTLGTRLRRPDVSLRPAHSAWVIAP